MSSELTWRLVLDLVGTFAFAVNGALTALRIARIDIVGAIALAMVTALGGGVLRDILMGALPPATFSDWRYLAVATVGGVLAFVTDRPLRRLHKLITVLDAAGLSLFAVAGALTALRAGLGAGQAVLLGGITGVGGGTLRDVLIGRIPTVLRSDLYAVPALLGAAAIVSGVKAGLDGPLVALVAAGACFVVRMLGVTFRLQVPRRGGG